MEKEHKEDTVIRPHRQCLRWGEQTQRDFKRQIDRRRGRKMKTGD